MGESSRIDRVPLWLIVLAVLLSPLIIAYVFAALTFHLLRSLWVHAAVWCVWLPRGQDTLIVYSDSPVWQHYIETEILPAVRSRAVILNWSERKRWRFGVARSAFRHFGGRREFNPLAVVFQPFRRARVFRFWQPFRDWKHGHGDSLAHLEAELFATLGISKGDPAA